MGGAMKDQRELEIKLSELARLAADAGIQQKNIVDAFWNTMTSETRILNFKMACDRTY